MVDIYPFNAIVPSDHKSRVHLNNDPSEVQLLKFFSLLQQKVMYCHEKKSFYCCRVSNTNFSMIGLVALINTNLVDKSIFQHERCIPLKRNTYLNNFVKYKTQLSPVILLHQDNVAIKNSLKEFVNNNYSCLKVYFLYELWALDDTSFYKNLYKNLNAFWIADGHHRIAAINKIGQNNLFAAFLISVNDILSGAIYREYLKVDQVSREILYSFLEKNFCISKNLNMDKGDFIFRLDSNRIYTVCASDNEPIRQ